MARILNIEKVVIPTRRPKTLNAWVAYLKHTHKTLVSSKFKDKQFTPQAR